MREIYFGNMEDGDAYLVHTFDEGAGVCGCVCVSVCLRVCVCVCVCVRRWDNWFGQQPGEAGTSADIASHTWNLHMLISSYILNTVWIHQLLINKQGRSALNRGFKQKGQTNENISEWDFLVFCLCDDDTLQVCSTVIWMTHFKHFKDGVRAQS